MAMVQYGLWPNCTNKCSFCLLKDRKYKSEEERLNLLKSVKENIDVIDWQDKFSDGISLLGGEVFYTESSKVKESFLDLIDIITDKILSISKKSKLSIVSNGIYDPNVLLIPVLDKLENKDLLEQFNLNFSYDLKYRFHSEKDLNSMISNTNLVFDRYGIKPIVQTCLTQYLIDAHLNGEFNIFEYQKENFPNTYISFLYPHKINTGEKVPDFFFTRSSLMKFIKYLKSLEKNEIIENFHQSVINSSQFKYTGLYDRQPVYDGTTEDYFIKQQPTLEEKRNLTDCGHSDMYRCYTDSDKCLLCDLEIIL